MSAGSPAGRDPWPTVGLVAVLAFVVVASLVQLSVVSGFDTAIASLFAGPFHAYMLGHARVYAIPRRVAV